MLIYTRNLFTASGISPSSCACASTPGEVPGLRAREKVSKVGAGRDVVWVRGGATHPHPPFDWPQPLFPAEIHGAYSVTSELTPCPLEACMP